MAPNKPKVKLTYFNLRGRAEYARLLLAYGGIEYEDCRVEGGDWGKLKPTTPYGSLPILEWNGETIAQSITLSRFIAKEVGLAGRCNLECGQANEIVDAVTDMFNAFSKAHFSKDEAAMKKVMTETLPTGLAQIEKRLTERGGQFLVGNALTWADIVVFNFCDFLPDQSVLAKVPKIKNLVGRVGEIPNIKNWVEKRPKTSI